jgi:hypothetical protein
MVPRCIGQSRCDRTLLIVLLCHCIASRAPKRRILSHVAVQNPLLARCASRYLLLGSKAASCRTHAPTTMAGRGRATHSDVGQRGRRTTTRVSCYSLLHTVKIRDFVRYSKFAAGSAFRLPDLPFRCRICPFADGSTRTSHQYLPSVAPTNPPNLQQRPRNEQLPLPLPPPPLLY